MRRRPIRRRSKRPPSRQSPRSAAPGCACQPGAGTVGRCRGADPELAGHPRRTTDVGGKLPPFCPPIGRQLPPARWLPRATAFAPTRAGRRGWFILRVRRRPSAPIRGFWSSASSRLERESDHPARAVGGHDAQPRDPACRRVRAVRGRDPRGDCFHSRHRRGSEPALQRGRSAPLPVPERDHAHGRQPNASLRLGDVRYRSRRPGSASHRGHRPRPGYEPRPGRSVGAEHSAAGNAAAGGPAGHGGGSRAAAAPSAAAPAAAPATTNPGTRLRATAAAPATDPDRQQRPRPAPSCRARSAPPRRSTVRPRRSTSRPTSP